MGDQKNGEEEKKVPVFTVFKKNSILKNIFLDAPQTNETPNLTANQEDEEEQVIVIGRHPDCSITLDHPSISRFHLRLHSKPSSLKLSLVDLSSVHGTWVSGKKVEPGVQVDLNEGDIVQLGGSSRRYRLHWVPMSRAYNLDVPFVPPMDVLMTVKETEELSNQDEICCSSIETNQIQSQHASIGDLDLSISKREITVSPSSPTMPEFRDSSCDSEEAKKGNLSKEECKQNEISGISSGQPLKEELIEEIKNQHTDKEMPFVPPMDVLMTVKETEELSNQDEICCSSIETNQIQSQHASVGDLDLSISKREITVSPSSPTMPEFRDSSCDSEEAKKGNLSKEECKQNEISGISSGQPLKEELIEEIKNQHTDKDSENLPNARSPSNDHNKDLFREEHEENDISGTPSKESAVTKIENQQSDEVHEENEILGFSSETPLMDSAVTKCENQQFDEEHIENEISGFSSETPLKESAVTQFEYQQSDEENDEHPQALDGILTGISFAKSPSGDNNKNLLREVYEENEISASSSGQLLNESVLEIVNQQFDEEHENLQAPDGAISGIANVNSSTIDHNEHPLREEHKISAISSGQLFSESVLEIESQQYDKACKDSQALDGVLSGIEDANSSPTNYHNEHPLRGEIEENEISAFSSGQLLNEPVVEITYLQYDGEDEKSQALDGDISGIADANSRPTIYPNESVQLLNGSVVEIGNQQYDEVHEKLQAVGVPHSLCHNYHNMKLPEFFNSSFSDEEMENEQEKISSSGCYSPCSSIILEREDQQYYLYEQDHSIQYSSSSEVYAIQPLKNTPSKSEQESNWPEIMRHSLSDVCAVVGESSEALDDESSLKGDNKQKEVMEVTVIIGAPKMDLMNLSICCESIPTEDCFVQLNEKINTGESFATNVSEPKDTDVNTPLKSGEQSDPPRSIREIPTSIGNQTGKCFPTNTEVKEQYKENLDYESVSEALISEVEVFAEEIFTPDKENFTPNTLKQRSTKKTDKLEAIKLLDPLCLSSPTKNSISWNFVQNEGLTFSSDKENHTPKVLQKSRLVQPASKNSARLNVETVTKNKISRIPFKSLLSDSSSKSCSNSTISNSGKYAQLIEKNSVAEDNKRWIMVADTNCLLNKVSRKALQLLQGVKGTRLIIPRVVIRELDCMKRRSYLFTRITEISLALQWIEDCMKYANWWIHVEGLMEEGRHLTPAPSLPTSEREIEDLAFSSASFSAFLNFLEIVSPTPGDHILDCALLNRGMKNDENLVILSDDVSLKIKAMAEGIICEAAEEFRESLVNPFSDRFLWTKSSPRGLTWSCGDDIVLREKYYRGPFKKPPSKSGESLKGLKLILV